MLQSILNTYSNARPETEGAKNDSNHYWNAKKRQIYFLTMRSKALNFSIIILATIALFIGCKNDSQEDADSNNRNDSGGHNQGTRVSSDSGATNSDSSENTAGDEVILDHAILQEGETIRSDVVEITAPEGSLAEPVTFRVTKKGSTGPSLPDGFVAVGDRIDIHVDNSESLVAPVLVKFFYDDTEIDDASRLVVLHYSGSEYRLATMVNWDDEENSISIVTQAFSLWQMVDSDDPATGPQRISDFGIQHTWNIVNTFQYDHEEIHDSLFPVGHCIGMAAYCAWHYSQPDSLNGRWPSSSPDSNNGYDYGIAELVAMRAHLMADNYDLWYWYSIITKSYHQRRVNRAIRLGIDKLNKPVTLILCGGHEQGAICHGVVAFGYDDDGLEIYDVNYSYDDPNKPLPKVLSSETLWEAPISIPPPPGVPVYPFPISTPLPIIYNEDHEYYEKYTVLGYIEPFSFGLGDAEGFSALTAQAVDEFAVSPHLAVTQPTPLETVLLPAEAPPNVDLEGIVDLNRSKLFIIVNGSIEEEVIDVETSKDFTKTILVKEGQNIVTLLAGVPQYSEDISKGVRRMRRVNGATLRIKFTAECPTETLWNSTTKQCECPGEMKWNTTENQCESPDGVDAGSSCAEGDIACICDPDGDGIITDTFSSLNDKLIAAIKRDLGERPITLEEATNTTTLHISLSSSTAQNSERILDISGIECFVNLTDLGMGYNDIINLDPLAGLTHLDRLYADGNMISDLSPLAGLTNLTSVSLYDNNISNLDPLAGLTNLNELNLDANRISDLRPLEGLTNLRSLSLRLNRISDLSPLAGLTNLRSLDVSRNRISDVNPLAGLVANKLNAFYFSDNQISDITALIDSLPEVDVGAGYISINMYMSIEGNTIPQSQVDVLIAKGVHLQ